MARKGIFRRNALIIGIVAIGGIILFGMVAQVSETFFTGFPAIPFTIPIPLELFDDRSIDCRIWVQGDIIDVDGVKTDIGFETKTFNPQFNLQIINPLTEEIVREVDTEIRIRCDPISITNFITKDNFRLTGGTLEYFWTATEGDGTIRFVTDRVTKQISPSNNVLQNSNGAGVTLANVKIAGTTIDKALTSTNEVYFTDPILVIKANPTFRFDVLGEDECATVNLLAGIPKLKIFNEQVDPPKPTSQIVNIVKLQTNPEELSQDDKNIQLEVRVQLPQWSEEEGSPRIDILRPSGSGFIIERGDIPITAKKLVDESTNTYEFFITRLSIPDEPIAGTWAIKATHPNRSGEDNELFLVFNKVSQAEPKSTGRSDDEPKTNPCDQLVGEAKVQCEAGEPGGDNDNGDSPFNFLEFRDFIACFSEANQFSCLNDSKYIPIFSIIGIVILLSVVGGRRAS